MSVELLENVMTPYAVTTGDIPKPLVELFRMMRTAFEKLPDFEGEVITCHAVCAAFAQRYKLTSVDGYFGTGEEHSWIIHPQFPDVIIDMYPINGASSFIVCKHWILTWGKLYIAQEIDYDKVIYERQVAKILAVI